MDKDKGNRTLSGVRVSSVTAPTAGVVGVKGGSDSSLHSMRRMMLENDPRTEAWDVKL